MNCSPWSQATAVFSFLDYKLLAYVVFNSSIQFQNFGTVNELLLDRLRRTLGTRLTDIIEIPPPQKKRGWERPAVVESCIRLAVFIYFFKNFRARTKYKKKN